MQATGKQRRLPAELQFAPICQTARAAKLQSMPLLWLDSAKAEWTELPCGYRLDAYRGPPIRAVVTRGIEIHKEPQMFPTEGEQIARASNAGLAGRSAGRSSLGLVESAWHFIPLVQAARTPSWIAGWLLSAVESRVLVRHLLARGFFSLWAPKGAKRDV
jgi:hypothetical protein